jgi:hypothetical protein
MGGSSGSGGVGSGSEVGIGSPISMSPRDELLTTYRKGMFRPLNALTRRRAKAKVVKSLNSDSNRV